MADTELQEIITTKRHDLHSYLIKHGSYAKLSSRLKDVCSVWKSNETNTTKPFLKSLLMGQIGYECYSRQKIRELPTHELCYTLLHLMNIFSI